MGQNIVEQGYESIANTAQGRDDLMNQVAIIAGGSNAKVDFTDSDKGEVTDNHIAGKDLALMAGITGNNADGTRSGSNVDITTGAGALVLDDVLQALSTVEQAAAQLVSADNKAQQAVNSLAKG